MITIWKLLKLYWERTNIKVRIHLVTILFLSGIVSIFDIVSIGMLIPVFVIIFEPNALERFPAPIGEFYQIIDIHVYGANMTPIAASFAVIFLLILKAYISWYTNAGSFKIGLQFNAITIKSLLESDMHESYRNSSQYLDVLMTQSHYITNYIVLPLVVLTGATSLLIAYISAIIYTFPNFATIISLLLVVFSVYIMIKLRKKSTEIAAKKTLNTASNVTRLIDDVFRNIFDVKLYKLQQVFLKKIVNADKSYKESQARNNFYAVIPKYLLDGSAIILLGMFAFLAEYNNFSAIYALAVITALGVSAQKLIPAVQQVFWAMNYLKLGEPHGKNLLKISNTISKKRPRVSLDDNFTIYIPKQKLNLSTGISINIPDLYVQSGEIVVINGESGIGKSSLMKAFCGEITSTPPISLKLINKDSEAEIVDLSEITGYVTQEPTIFQSSLIDNLKLYNVDASFGEIEEKFELLNLTKLLERDKVRYSECTEESDYIMEMSGGQKQRFSIIRADLTKRKILIFDEPTSALDGENSELVENYLALMKNRLIFVITHKEMSHIRPSQVWKIKNGELYTET